MPRAPLYHPIRRAPGFKSICFSHLPRSVCTFASDQHFIWRQPIALTLCQLVSGLLQRVYQSFELPHQ